MVILVLMIERIKLILLRYYTWIILYIYKDYIEEDTNNRIVWFDDGLTMNFFTES